MNRTLFSRRHYEAVAELFRDESKPVAAFEVGADKMKLYLCDKFADMFAVDNPKFDRALFEKACGLEAENEMR